MKTTYIVISNPTGIYSQVIETMVSIAAGEPAWGLRNKWLHSWTCCI